MRGNKQRLQQQADLGANALSLQGQSLNAVAARGADEGAKYGLAKSGSGMGEAIGFDQQGRPVTQQPSAGSEAMGVQGDPATAFGTVAHETASGPADPSPGCLDYGEDDPGDDIADVLGKVYAKDTSPAPPPEDPDDVTDLLAQFEDEP